MFIAIVGGLAANLTTLLVVALAIALVRHVSVGPSVGATVLVVVGWLVFVVMALLSGGVRRFAQGGVIWRGFVWGMLAVDTVGSIVLLLLWTGRVAGIK